MLSFLHDKWHQQLSCHLFHEVNFILEMVLMNKASKKERVMITTVKTLVQTTVAKNENTAVCGKLSY